MVQDALRAGMQLHTAGRLPEAEQIYRQVLAADPDNPDALHLLAVVASQSGDLAASAQLIEKAVRLRPQSPVFRNSAGETYRATGWLYKAIDSYNTALLLKPDYVEALYNRSLAFNALERYRDALAGCDEVLRIRPGLAEALGNRGVALEGLGRYEEALASYEEALKAKPELVEAWNNRGQTLGRLDRREEALASFGKALALRPDYAEAHNNLGNALRELGRLQEAEASYRQALALKPGHAEVHHNLGLALRDLGKFAEAEESLRRALALKRGHVPAHCALGSVLFNLGRMSEAEECFRQALAIDAGCTEAYGFWVHLCQQLCAFPAVAEHAGALRQRVTQDKSGDVVPFMFLALPETEAGEQLACARQYADRHFAGLLSRPLARGDAVRPGRDRLRIGYLSADYHEHATSYLLAEVIELHDRSRFETVGYSYGPDDGGPMRRRMRAAFDRFCDIRDASHASAARRIFEDGIDILVDLKGHTGSNRLQILAMRPAPVQVSWLGYPGTLGNRGLADYLIGDAVVTPAEHSAHYGETLVLMPHCYQPNDRQRAAGTRPSRAEAGLPPEGFVFCSFNQSYKITREVFHLWCGLLTAVPGSVLWLLRPNPAAEEHLRREAQAQGIAPGRLVFAPPLPQQPHLARLQLADLALDTYPYTSHTTASDAIWLGVPLVTRIGETFVSRVAASILEAAGMSELIAATPQAYYRLALDLASQPGRMAHVRARLAANRMTCPLFDSKRFSRNLENAYRQIWADSRNDRKAPVIVVRE